MPSLKFIVIDAVICFIIGSAVTSSRGRSSDGAKLGLFLGPIGVLIALTLKPTPEHEAARAEAIEAERRRLRLRGETEE